MQSPANLLAVLLIAAIAANRVSAAEAHASDYQPGPAPGPVVMEDYFAAAPSPWWTVQGGVEATYLSLEMRALEEGISSGEPVAFGFEAAPRIWLQAENACGWGGQVRYWQYDAEAALQTVLIDVITAGIFAEFNLDQAAAVEMYAIDAEITRAFDVGDSELMATLGGRHGAITASSLTSALLISGPSLFDALSAQRTDEFHGGGLTASLAAIRPIGDGRWSLFGSIRGSVLWGEEQRSARTTLRAGAVVASSSAVAVDDAAELAILEAQFGLQWQHDLAYGRGRVFSRTAFEYQNWNATADTAPGPLGGPSQLDADLYGISFAVGIMR